MKVSSLLLAVVMVVGSSGLSRAQESHPAAHDERKPATAAPSSVVIYDLSAARDNAANADDKQLRKFYDEVFLVTSLQGLVNRSGPRMFVRYNRKLDDFWWNLSKQPDGWLASAKIETAASLETLLVRFRDYYKGAVVYDESVPATSNLAATIAGADDLLVLRYDTDPQSLYSRLTSGPKALPVKARLIKEDGTPLFTGAGTIPDSQTLSSGSAKNDAYRWLVENYLKKGKLNPVELGFYIDAFWLRCWGKAVDTHTLNNLDYIIARKGLVFDLHNYDDETPVDDPHQPLGTDFETLRLIYAACNEQTGASQIIYQHGFIPWAYKYTNFKTSSWDAKGRHEGVPVEWRGCQVASNYNIAVDADALGPSNMVNASFYQHQPIPERVAQVADQPSRERLIKQGILGRDGSIPDVVFYAHYGGDYDSCAWLYQMMPEIWSDPLRGNLPVSWAINPSLAARFPTALLWMRRTATPNDSFVTGDCGAGYLNPSQLTPPRQWSNLPSGLPQWEKVNTRAFRQWDLHVSGFIIDGNTPFMNQEVLEAYARFSPGGMATQNVPAAPVMAGIPLLQMRLDLDQDVAVAAKNLRDIMNKPGAKFLPVRSILWTPTKFVELEAELDKLGTPPRKLVDLPTLLWLAKYRADSKATNPGQ